MITGLWTKAGYTMFLNGKDYFFVTNTKRKTKQLIVKCIKALGCEGYTQADIDYVTANLQKGYITLKQMESGHKYYDIYGYGFGGRGSDNVTDGKTVIIYIRN